LVMKDWQESFKGEHSGDKTIALVTRDCTECETRVRVGAIISPLSPQRPAGERAFCAKCQMVTLSPVVEVRGLRVEDGDGTEDEDLDE
jgi:hypothetical protein